MSDYTYIDLLDEVDCSDHCEAVIALCELVDKLVADIQFLELECISTRYLLSQYMDKEEVIYTKEKYVNDYIVKYNRLYPDNMVELDMVDYWLTGGGNYATTVTFDNFVIDFGESDGYPMYHLWADNGIDEDNKDAFIDEAMKWIDVIFELSDENMEIVRRNLSLDKSEIRFNLPRDYLVFKENGRDHHLDYHDYIITIGPLRDY